MSVGIYVDGYDLYHGMKSECEDVPSGWKWLDSNGTLTNKMSLLAQLNKKVLPG